MGRADVAVIGGGIVGMGIAGELATHFDSVVLLEKSYLSREATHASGGMLSPYMELEYHEPQLLKLWTRGLRIHAEFCRKLEAETNMGVGADDSGTLMVAMDDPQQRKIERLYEHQRHLDLEVERLSGEDCRDREPLVSSRVRMGLFAPGEGRVNNRLLGLALALRCRRRGVRIRSNEAVKRIVYGGDGRVKELRTEYGGLEVDRVVVAAGAWSGDLPGLKPVDRLPVRPVKGQALAVRPGEGFRPKHVVRTPEVYGVPHYPERFLLGASMEEQGFCGGNTAGKIFDLLWEGARLLPKLKRQPLLETWWGFRPASRDALPILGPSARTPNLYFATGHYRHGILLAPITVRLLSHCITREKIPPLMEPFLPDRFQPPAEEEHREKAGGEHPSPGTGTVIDRS